MNSKAILATTLVAIAATLAIIPAAATDFLDPAVTSTKSDTNELKAKLTATDEIPRNNEGGAFGYGIITEAGLSAILVTTTHAGVLDSAEQDGVNDPEWHNHYVALQASNGPGGSGLCTGLEVADITFHAPGDVRVRENMAQFDGPKSFSSFNPLNGVPNSFNAGHVIGLVVSFTIQPVNSSGQTDPVNIAAVCINDVNPLS